MCVIFRLVREEDGQTILEYALIIAVFVLVVVSVIPGLRNSVSNVFNKMKSVLDSAPLS